MGTPAARVTDRVAHPLPGVLQPGPGAFTVLIGNLPAWRGVPALAAAAIQAAKAVSDATVTAATAAATAAMGTPAAPAAKAAEEVAKAAALSAMSGIMSAAASASMSPSGGMPDTHICGTFPPTPAHGPGMVLDGNPTILINGLPACQVGDKVTEALGPPDPIIMGKVDVLLGENNGGGGAGGSGAGGGGLLGALATAMGLAAGAAAAALSIAAGLVEFVVEVGKAVVDAAVAFGKAIANAVVNGVKNFIQAVKDALTSPKSKAIDVVANSDFAKTVEGKKVLKKINDLDAAGKINIKPMKGSTRGNWSKGKIGVNEKYANDPDAIASELVHEATHAVNEDDFPASITKLTIDEEIRTNSNQLDLYEEQRAGGYRDPELERRRTARKNGKLRDDVRNRYAGKPESL